MSKKVTLVVLDGFGINPKEEGNAVVQADSPVFNKLFNSNYTELEASSRFVGLPEGQMGNSEVGHLALGSGRVNKQNLVQIEDMLQDGSFEQLDTYKKMIEHCNEKSSV